MALALVAHVTNSDRLHLWVGVTGGDAVPALQWTLDGAPVDPDPKRPLQLVLSGALGAKSKQSVWTGCFEFTGLLADRIYDVGVNTGNASAMRQVRTIPKQLPNGPQDRFNVLLLSCFDRDEDATGLAGEMLSKIRVKPDLTIFAGDQIYLDIPTAENFLDDAAWLANRFQTNYVANWFGDAGQPANPREVAHGFPQVLALAPCAFIPDDHEYWNNFPFSSPPVQNSWKFAGRERWRDAAEQVYKGFQQTAASSFGCGRVLNIAPLSILFLDTRSQRDFGNEDSEPSRSRDGDLLGNAGRAQFQSWVDDLVATATTGNPSYGMLVSGQSLFSPAAGRFKGDLTDYEYSDYAADFRFMVHQLERITAAGLPVILATGDVHWGRILEAHGVAAASGPLYEIISSPTSLVSTIIADQAKEIWGAIKSVFGAKDPWPRHSDAQNPPAYFGSTKQYLVAIARRANQEPAVMRGNQAALLRFAQLAGGIDVEVTFYPLSGDLAFDNAEEWSVSFKLRPPRHFAI